MMGTHQIITEIEIDATPGRVWSVLSDFSAYPEWNPFIRFIRGDLEKGARLEVRIQPDGGMAMTFRPLVLVADQGRELEWVGHFISPVLFEGRHRFFIEPLADGKVKFRQSESFRGILVPFLRAMLDQGTKCGFEEMDRALKARAESPAEGSSDIGG